MFHKFAAITLAILSQVAFAENGADYKELYSCSMPGGMVRIDWYLGYGNGSSNGAPLRPRIQVVFVGESGNTLMHAGLYPTKISTVPSEFIIDELELRAQGANLVARTEAGSRPSVYGIALNREQGTLEVAEYYDRTVISSVTFTDLSCPQ